MVNLKKALRFYNTEIERIATENEILKDKFDIVLDPIETIPEPDEFLNAFSAKNWGLDFLGVNKNFNRIIEKKNKRPVFFGVIDTAGKLTHKDFEGIEIEGSTHTGELPFDGHGHATHVAGIITSKNESVGVCSALAKQGLSKVMVLKGLHNSGVGKMNELTEAANAFKIQAKKYIDSGHFVILNNSWGGSGKTDSTIGKVFDELREMGVLIVCAAGNNGSGVIGQPAEHKSCIAIGALDSKGKKATYSQYGKGLHLTNAGSGIYSCYPNNQYKVLSGTSMATPQQAGIYGLIASYWPEYNADEIEAHAQKYATDLGATGYDVLYGFGADILTALLDNEPVKGAKPLDPSENEPDEDETPTREERKISFPIIDLQSVWGINGMNDRRPIKFDFIIEATTKLMAPEVNDQATDFARQLFKNLGLLFTRKDADVYDAAKFMIHFFEMFSNRRTKLDLNVVRIDFKDENGYLFTLDGAGIGANTVMTFDKMPILFQLEKK